ncbi:MAG: oligoendopeptidase F [Bacillota bacterium]
MPINRTQVAEQDKWDLSGMFKTEAEYEEKYASVKSRIPECKKFENKLDRSNTLECLVLESALSRDVELLYVYAMLRSDENTADPKFQSLKGRAQMLWVELATATSFISGELALMPTETLQDMANDPSFVNFSCGLTSIIRNKAHILSPKEEKLMSEIGSFSGDFKNIFGMFDNADIKFGKVTNQEGEKVELCHGMYSVLLGSNNQKVRANAFNKYYKSYKDMLNTVAATYAGSVKKDCTMASIRGYKSALDCALQRERVTENVYNNLLSAVKEATPHLHKYVALRKKALNVDTLNMYDMYVPITAEGRLDLSYNEAYDLVVDALAPLGTEYQELLRTARTSRWIDVYETENKRSGAYSSGCYDSNPHVLLNYNRTTHDVFTIAHELGHSLHSYMSTKAQCYEKADYVIFVAEVASTVNEVLMIKHLLKEAKGEMRKFLLSYYLDMFRTTLFRQTMFAEFEKFSHEQFEAGNTLTAELMSAKYYELNKEYYGSAVKHNKNISYEWSRIPHFYNAFYVYKYATGITAAVNIANNILADDNYKSKYFEALSLGGSRDPLDILRVAEVDLESKVPFECAMAEFSAVLTELEGMM